MVVVSASWVKNVASYPPNSDIALPFEKKMAKAILTCRPNSHPFQERILTLDQPIKVGRSVARAKPTSTNAIFDCKVLSRHHALLWYEDGKFYLQDTKSSNGTFVNNNKLSTETENHELSSGDIVQFGVDVVENNRKVTHGCIIATIKLYLPDGKEAKASPSVKDHDFRGILPLDDLYRLNQVIQEANQREQCLETKLIALQQIVDETRKATEESWQAYIGEERLLSRVSALEYQLQQLNKNWTEDKLKEELFKLKEDNEVYQIAAKEALEKLHAERLHAVSLAMEQERARLSAEQETALAEEQFSHAQLELEIVVSKLSDQQKKYEEQRNNLEQRERDLEAKLEIESEKVLDLQLKLQEVSALPIQDIQEFRGKEEESSIYGNLKSMEKLLAENEEVDSILIESNRHINLMVPRENEDSADRTKDDEENYEKDVSNHIDSKTLKYQFQSAQNELKKKIELLEAISNENKCKMTELEKALNEEKVISHEKLIENDSLKRELGVLQQKWKESSNENHQYKDKIQQLVNDLETVNIKLKEAYKSDKVKNDQSTSLSTLSNNMLTYNQLVNLEEELVILKESFAQISEEKVKLQRELLSMTEKYNTACTCFYNKYFFYIAPLIFMVLYLLVSAMIS